PNPCATGVEMAPAGGFIPGVTYTVSLDAYIPEADAGTPADCSYTLPGPVGVVNPQTPGRGIALTVNGIVQSDLAKNLVIDQLPNTANSSGRLSITFTARNSSERVTVLPP